MLSIYLGKTKDKTRLLIGSAVVLAAKGKNALFVSFGSDNEEIYKETFEYFPNITKLFSPVALDSDVEMTQARLVQTSKVFRDLFDTAVKMALTCKYDMLILDGIFDTAEKGYLTESEIYDFLSNIPDSLEVICSGKTANEKFIQLAKNAINLLDSTEQNLSDSE
ncbi:MAG: cob(I)yrinic acid a,c-diamide adenosyltransferase [Oscillospiraceae bacterium]|nr:cob(I)yrinic acid a,c-diamide adenosyltransferase [Candidatus Ruminococcus equi]